MARSFGGAAPGDVRLRPYSERGGVEASAGASGFGRSGYHIPWNKLDFSDVIRPRLSCAVRELAPLE
jgi:hypothetical protein